MIKRYLFFVFVILMASPISAQKKEQSYQYQRAFELLTKDDNEKEAVKYFQEDLANNSKNGYSWYWMAVVYYTHSQYGEALKNANNALKYIPSSDKAYASRINSVLCDIYLNLEDTVKALERVDKAIKIDKKSESFREKRGHIYLNKGEFEKARKDFNAMLKINEASAPAYVGLGRIDLYQGQKEAARENFSKAINLNSQYQAAYSWRALVHEQNQNYSDALTDHIAALYLGFSSFDYMRLRYISSFMMSETIDRLQSVASKNKSTSLWYYIIGLLYEDNGLFESAIEAYKEAGNIDQKDYFLSKIANCYNELGNYSCALSKINDAIAENPNEANYYLILATTLDLTGQYDEVLANLEQALNVSEDDEKYQVYYHRGWIKMYNNDIRGALADFNKSIALEKDYSYNYLCRGRIYDELGLKTEANRDFRMVVSLENDTNLYYARPFAHYYLGQIDEAKQTITVALHNGGSLYDAACLFSLLSENTQSLDYLEKAFQSGYRNFAHINREHYLDNIRSTSRFKKLIEKYKALPIMCDCGENITYVDTVVYIPFSKKGSIYEVRCSVNGLPLNFIFDTGAGDVCLSSSEASMMLKQGYLVMDDIKGSNRFQTADGNISIGTTVNLRNVEIGGLQISDVTATIVNNDKAPALLGQSVLRRFGSVEIDYDKKQIKLTGKIPIKSVELGADELSPEAIDGAKDLRKLLKNSQEDSRRTSKYQTKRDALAYDTDDAIRELPFYQKYCKQDADFQSKNTSIMQVSQLYKTTLNTIKDFINGGIDELDFSEILNKLNVLK